LPKKLTLNQFISNPTGKYSAEVGRRDLIKNSLERQFKALLREHNGKFQWKIFQPSANKNNFLFHFKIPSTTKKDLFYDVVLQFNENNKGKTTISEFDMKVFSNAPNFMFTYAYVLNEDGLLIDLLKSKIDKRALTQEPDKRNPRQDLGFEKSMYFAGLYIKDARMYYISQIKNNVSRWNRSAFLDSIANTSEKLEEYQSKEKKDKK